MKCLAAIAILTAALCVGCQMKTTPQQRDNQLHSAIIRGDIRQAREALSQSQDPAALATKYIGIAMIHTSRSQHTEMIKLLVNNGADMNAPSIHYSLLNDGLTFNKLTPELLEWLIENGCNVNQVDAHNRTALTMCFEKFRYDSNQSNQYYKMFQILIDNGADVNRSTHYPSMLHEVATFGVIKQFHKELLELLIDAGIDLEIKDKDGKTALFQAIVFGHQEIAEQLLEHGASHDTADQFGTTALFKAASMGYTRCVEMLITQGADVNAVNTGGYTPLRFAINHPDNMEIIELLLQGGADVNHLKNGKTVLDAVDKRNTCRPAAEAETDKQKFIQLLTKYGAKTASQLKEKNT